MTKAKSYHYLAKIEKRKKNWWGVVDYNTEAIREFQSYPEALLERAEGYKNLGKEEEANRDYRVADMIERMQMFGEEKQQKEEKEQKEE